MGFIKKYGLLILFSVFCAASCAKVKQTNELQEVYRKPVIKNTVSLNSGNFEKWTLFFGVQDKNAPQTPKELQHSTFQKIDATVPGNVEIDLERAGLIEDPSIGDNIYQLRKYESYQWWYCRKFNRPDVPKDHKIELCFEGIDCIADIWLNSRKIAHVENMFVEHHYDVTDLLEEKNELHICIYSTVLEGRKHLRNNMGSRSDALAESVNIRKAPHMFGWDILPRLISAGLWRDVKLEIIPPTFFESVYWVANDVNIQNKTANIYVDWQFNTDRLNIDDLTLLIQVKKDNTILYEKAVKVYTTLAREQTGMLENVDFWWPRGFGKPSLYEASLKIIDTDGKILCENKQNIGIRTSRLILTEVNTKENPGEFIFEINGEKIFIKGTNWVALDALHSRDKQHLKNTFDMLVDLNCNMVRLWGGNVYESDEFYNLCDKNGIMAWQDFTMGCTIYPQNDAFAKKISEEAKKVILRLRNHPSIVLWAGNNENDVSLDWGGLQSHIDPNTDIISRQVLPMAVREYDPKTSYLPSSPFISSKVFNLNNRIDVTASPERHLWGPRGYYKAPFYTSHIAKFVSEIGYHGCPNKESLEKMMEPEFVYPWTRDFIWNEQWQAKASVSHPYSEVSTQRNNLMLNQIRSVFGDIPTDIDRFILASQIVQAEAKKYFIEFWRIDKFDRNGILWWNLRDGWPVISDAVVDYYGGKKLAYEYIKKVQTDVCVMIGDAKNRQHPIVVVNDTLEPVSGSIKINDADSGKIVFNGTFSVGKNNKTIAGFLPEPKTTKMWIIEWEMKGDKYRNHYLAYQPVISLDDYLNWLPLLK
jgi:beta-mannosidase